MEAKNTPTNWSIETSEVINKLHSTNLVFESSLIAIFIAPITHKF